MSDFFKRSGTSLQRFDVPERRAVRRVPGVRGDGEWVAERAGTLNISVEGMLLGRGLHACSRLRRHRLVDVGVLAGMLGGMIIAGVQAEMSHRLAADQFVVGLTLNISGARADRLPRQRTRTRHKLAGTWRSRCCRHPADRPGAVRAAVAVLLLYLLFRSRGGWCIAPGGGSNSGRRARTLSRPTSPGSTSTSGAARSIYYAGFTSGLGGAF